LRDDVTETLEDYEGELRAMAAKAMPMICANPDIIIHRGGTLIYCAGALAQRYESIGGAVTYAGKPYLPIYERALSLAERLSGAPVNRKRVLAIGDGMKTDIAGAAASGLDALFVTHGIHREALHGETSDGRIDPDGLERLCAEYGLWPAGVIAALRD
jgi:HAD superfamily hydrolase (TIGR01459 family)